MADQWLILVVLLPFPAVGTFPHAGVIRAANAILGDPLPVPTRPLRTGIPHPTAETPPAWGNPTPAVIRAVYVMLAGTAPADRRDTILNQIRKYTRLTWEGVKMDSCTKDVIVAYRVFVDGTRRPILEEPGGRQYVISDDDGTRTYGLWFIPPGECPKPLIVTNEDRHGPSQGSKLESF
jgi:hypothetical protein